MHLSGTLALCDNDVLCRSCSACWGIDLDASSTLAFWAVMFCAEIVEEYTEEDRLTRKCIFRVL